MLFILFVFFYLFSDKAPWWVIALAIFAVLFDFAEEHLK